jgi:glucose/arabinose dehydrogenase
MGMRVRDVMEGADGSLYVLKDGKDGALIRVTPRENAARR